jgi:hypothetical protein
MLATTGYTSVTGLDFNMWISKVMTRKQVVDTLKANLEIRMKGGNAPANRAPFFIGGHTDLYSNNNADANAAAVASVADRRAAIEGAGLSLEDGLALEAEIGRASIETGIRGATRFAAGEGRGAQGAGV